MSAPVWLPSVGQMAWWTVRFVAAVVAAGAVGLLLLGASGRRAR